MKLSSIPIDQLRRELQSRGEKRDQEPRCSCGSQMYWSSGSWSFRSGWKCWKTHSPRERCPYGAGST